MSEIKLNLKVSKEQRAIRKIEKIADQELGLNKNNRSRMLDHLKGLMNEQRTSKDKS